MKVIIAGGTGFLGSALADHFSTKGEEVIILTRGDASSRNKIKLYHWDGRTLGPWASSLEGADVLINLSGKSVDCRYTERNRKLIYSSRLSATRVLGEAIQKCKNPPKLWINAASATIYRHSLDKEMDETSGEIGTGFSVDVCLKWEKAFNEAIVPSTRKMAMRTGIVLGKRGPLQPLKILAKLGIGGKQGPGTQYFSWLHEKDFINIVEFIISKSSMQGIYNVTAPTPIPNKDFMKALRKALDIPFGIPLPVPLLKFGAIVIGTETELILKSRRVVPRRLLELGYRFEFANINAALEDLCLRE